MDASQQNQFTLTTPNGDFNVIFPNVKAIIIEERRKDFGNENGRIKCDDELPRTVTCEKDGNNHFLPNARKAKVRPTEQTSIFDWSDEKLQKKQNLSGFCDTCGKHYKNLQQHKLVHDTGSRKKHSCDFCGKELTSKRSLQLHLEVHEGRKQRKCLKCDKVYFSQTGYDKHVKRHDIGTTKPFLCTICGKSYSCRFSFVDHANIHAGVKPYECEMCGMKFSYGNVLRDHMTIHTGQKSYKCPNCDQTFGTLNGRKSHVKYKHREKRFECEKCGHKCAIKSDLTKHLRSHGIGQTKFPCGICKKVLKCPQYLRYHMKLHAKHTCTICAEQFANEKDLALHLKMFADQIPFSCSECDNQFHEKLSLQDHVMLNHEPHKDQEKMQITSENCEKSCSLQDVNAGNVASGKNGDLNAAFEELLDYAEKQLEPSDAMQKEKVDESLLSPAKTEISTAPFVQIPIFLKEGENLDALTNRGQDFSSKTSSDDDYLHSDAGGGNEQKNGNYAIQTEHTQVQASGRLYKSSNIHSPPERQNLQVFQNDRERANIVGKQSQGTQTIKTFSGSEESDSLEDEEGDKVQSASLSTTVKSVPKKPVLSRTFSLENRDPLSPKAALSVPVSRSFVPGQSAFSQVRPHSQTNMNVPFSSAVETEPLQGLIKTQYSSNAKFQADPSVPMTTNETGYPGNVEKHFHFPVTMVTEENRRFKTAGGLLGSGDSTVANSQVMSGYFSVLPSTSGVDQTFNCPLAAVTPQDSPFVDYLQCNLRPLSDNSDMLAAGDNGHEINSVVPHQHQSQLVPPQSLNQPIAHGLTSINYNLNGLEYVPATASISSFENPTFHYNQRCVQSLPHADVLLSRRAVKLSTQTISSNSSYEQDCTGRDPMSTTDPRVYLCPEGTSVNPKSDVPLSSQSFSIPQSSGSYQVLSAVNYMCDTFDHTPEALEEQQQNTVALDRSFECTPCELENLASINVFDQYSIPSPPPTLFPTQIQSWQISTLDHTLQFTFPDETSSTDLCQNMQLDFPETRPTFVHEYTNLETQNSLASEAALNKPPPEVNTQASKSGPRTNSCVTCGKKLADKQKNLLKGSCEACQQEHCSGLHCSHQLSSSFENVSFSCDVYSQDSIKDNGNHSKKREVEKEFKCETCGKRYQQEKYLKTHRKTHCLGTASPSGRELFTCDICSQAFEDRNSFKLHLNRHENLFCCDVCREIFKDKETLARHKKSYEGVIPTTCGVCGKTFHSKSFASEHMLKHATL